MKDNKVLGIDLAKNVCQLQGTNAKGKSVIKKRLSREKEPRTVLRALKDSN